MTDTGHNYDRICTHCHGVATHMVADDDGIHYRCIDCLKCAGVHNCAWCNDRMTGHPYFYYDRAYCWTCFEKKARRDRSEFKKSNTCLECEKPAVAKAGGKPICKDHLDMLKKFIGFVIK